MHIQKVAIIEDTLKDFNKLSEKITREKYKGVLEWDFSIGCITSATHFRSYCEKILNSESNIFFLDWELIVSNVTRTPKEIFEYIKEKRPEFDFYSKFWVFYSGSAIAGEVDDFVNTFFIEDSPCHHRPGKANVLDDGEYLKSDFFDLSIQKGLEHLNHLSIPDWVRQLPIPKNKEIITFQRFKATFFHLEKNINKADSKYLKLDIHRYICTAISWKFAILVFIDHQNLVQFRFIKANHDLKKYKEILHDRTDYGVISAPGMEYNDTYFEFRSKKVCLKEEFKPYIQYRSHLLHNLYNYNESTSFRQAFNDINRDYIKNIFTRLLRYEVISEMPPI